MNKTRIERMIRELHAEPALRCFEDTAAKGPEDPLAPMSPHDVRLIGYGKLVVCGALVACLLVVGLLLPP